MGFDSFKGNNYILCGAYTYGYDHVQVESGARPEPNATRRTRITKPR
jgi:hypothetical protein